MLKKSVDEHHIINVGTDGENDQDKNACGIATGHAYSVHDAFTVNEANGVTADLVMIRNPWGEAFYNLVFGPNCVRWTDDVIS